VQPVRLVLWAMRIPRWQKFDPAVRVFEVECRCGAEFRVPYDPEAAARRPDDPFLARLTGSCPWCGLKLEEIEPFEDAALRRPR
jgi:hypothetical protein